MAHDHAYDMQHSTYMDAHHEDMLLQGNYHQNTRSVQSVTDRLEAAGERCERMLDGVKLSYSSLFFGAAWATIAASFLGLWRAIFELALVDLVISLSLLVFGSVMLLLDVPGAPAWASPYRRVVYKQARFLTRVTGRSLWYLYLAVMILVALWPSGKLRNGAGVTFILGILLATVVATAAVIGLGIGLRKSLLLESIRLNIVQRYRDNYSDLFRKYAMLDVNHGMQFPEFNTLCGEFSSHRIRWNEVEGAMIFNALDEAQKGAVNEKEFCQWATGGCVYL